MGRTALGVGLVVAFAGLTGCAGSGQEAQEAVTVTLTASPTPSSAAASDPVETDAAEAEPDETDPVEDAPEPGLGPSASDGPAETGDPVADLPARYEMEDWERVMAEVFYVGALRDESVGEAHTDEELVAAGDAACDAMDDGLEIRDLLIATVVHVPELESLDNAAILAGTASGVLCPEHAGYSLAGDGDS